jgi:hypothetical protein
MSRLLGALALSFVPLAALSQTKTTPAANALDSPAAQAAADAAADATRAYWTPARMAAARPMPTPLVVLDSAAAAEATSAVEVAAPELALPGFAPGWHPRMRPHRDVRYFIPRGHPMYPVTASTEDGFQPQYGPAPANPKDGPYGPFQRYTEFDPIISYPQSTHGKLFFTLPGLGNFVCSATVVHRNTVFTAGHCNALGGSGAGFATRRLFCPSYRNGVDPARGCWAVVASKTSAGWLVNGDPDYDYACLITRPTGTVVASQIGNVTGWLGRAWNFAHSQAVRTFGYPQAAPFDGNRLLTTQSTEWYSHDFRPGGQTSKIIGSDLTGGSSGGSWVMGWNNPGDEFPDTDGTLSTDPGNLWIAGVNSHKRCVGDCSSPPTTTTGVFWQEMSSPPFLNTAAPDESEDILAVCFANGGT